MTSPDPLPAGQAPARWHRRALSRWRHSLSLRLVGLFLLLALVMSATFLFGMQRAFGSGWRELVRPLVADYVDHLAADIGSPPDVARAQALVDRLPLAVQIDGPVVRWRSFSADSRLARHHGRGGAWRGDSGDEGDWLQRTTADGHQIRFFLDTQAWARQPRAIGWVTLAVLLLLTLLAGWLVHRLFRPIQDIGAGAQRYGRGDFSQPIPVRRRDELGELAGQVNTMAEELSRRLESQRALLLAISHELRSPLTRARLHAELVAEGPERDALLRDLGQMRDLVSDLLESERLAQPQAALHLEPCDLNALVSELLAGPLAGREVALDLPEDLPPGQADLSRLALLLRNLLDNAWRHAAGAAQPPRLSARLEGGRLRLTVRDFGPGVPPEALSRLAEPFHRLDPARQRATGGVGLGLYLCRRVAEAHGGRLSFQAADPGLSVQVDLPWPSVGSSSGYRHGPHAGPHRAGGWHHPGP